MPNLSASLNIDTVKDALQWYMHFKEGETSLRKPRNDMNVVSPSLSIASTLLWKPFLMDTQPHPDMMRGSSSSVLLQRFCTLAQRPHNEHFICYCARTSVFLAEMNEIPRKRVEDSRVGREDWETRLPGCVGVSAHQLPKSQVCAQDPFCTPWELCAHYHGITQGGVLCFSYEGKGMNEIRLFNFFNKKF